MRLLRWNNVQFVLETFPTKEAPPYAILSHTWSDEEITYQDLTNGAGHNKLGYKKLNFCNCKALREGLQYFWIDTCCIDKSSSAELAENINSMFQYYLHAIKCYVFLPDVGGCKGGITEPSTASWESQFARSRWFTRGWTLQELIAARYVEFYSCEGEKLGTKRRLQRQIQDITGIPVEALQGQPLNTFTINQRMSWAESRETTLEEDQAYCLLGIFNASVPVIYGEGKMKAFGRLRDEIMKHWNEIGKPVSATLQLMGEKRLHLWTCCNCGDVSTTVMPERCVMCSHDWCFECEDFIAIRWTKVHHYSLTAFHEPKEEKPAPGTLQCG